MVSSGSSTGSPILNGTLSSSPLRKPLRVSALSRKRTMFSMETYLNP